MDFNFKLLSALIFGGGLIFCITAIIYAKLKRKISDKIYCFVCFSCAGAVVVSLMLSLLLKGLPFWQFAIICLGAEGVFSVSYFIFRSIPTKLRQGVEISCKEEWINLSYLLTLIERAERFCLSTPEQEFMDNFKNKVKRLTSYYASELPTGIEISRFYKICYRIGIV